jgi:hypothetical protein
MDVEKCHPEDSSLESRLQLALTTFAGAAWSEEASV